MKRCIGWVMLVWLGLAALAGAQDQGNREPKVTEKEATVLAGISELMQSNPGKAETQLRGQLDKSCSPALDFAMGNILFQKGDVPGAEAAYRRALDKMPAFDRARANLARVLLQRDQVSEARKQLDQIMLTRDNSASVMTLTGYIFLLEDKPIAAETAYRQALLAAPDDSNAYLGLAKTLLMQERYQEAARLLESLLREFPQREEVWSNLANARLSMEQYDRAIIALETARRLNATSSMALATLGDLYMNRAQYEDALDAYNAAFAAETPSIDRLLRIIEAFLQVNEAEKAASLFEKAETYLVENQLTAEQSGKLSWLKARRFQLAGKYESARKAYQSLLEKDPLNGKALLALGDLYAENRKVDEAMAIYARAGRIQAVQVTAWTKQAGLEVEQGHYENAISLLLDVQAIEPRESIARYIEQLRYLKR